MTTRLSSQGQVAIPDEFRRLDDLKPGDNFEMRRTGPGQYVLKKVKEVDQRATRCRSPYGHDVLVAPADATPLTAELVKELLNEV